jgi:hypothetical protein
MTHPEGEIPTGGEAWGFDSLVLKGGSASRRRGAYLPLGGGESDFDELGERKPPKHQKSQVRGSVRRATVTDPLTNKI